MESNKKMVVYSSTVSPRVKRTIRNILLSKVTEDLDRQFLRLIPVSKKKAEMMTNPFIQRFYFTHDIYLVDFCLGQRKGKNIWQPLAKIAVDPQVVEGEKTLLKEE